MCDRPGWPRAEDRRPAQRQAGQGRRAASRRALARENTRNPRLVVTDRLTCYPGALQAMTREGELWRFARHPRGRWLNTLVEQDHRRIKGRTGPMLGLASFRSARRRLAGVEALAMLSKGQVGAVRRDATPAQRALVAGLFGLSACAARHRTELDPQTSTQRIQRKRQ